MNVSPPTRSTPNKMKDKPYFKEAPLADNIETVIKAIINAVPVSGSNKIKKKMAPTTKLGFIIVCKNSDSNSYGFLEKIYARYQITKTLAHSAGSKENTGSRIHRLTPEHA